MNEMRKTSILIILILLQNCLRLTNHTDERRICLKSVHSNGSSNIIEIDEMHVELMTV